MTDIPAKAYLLVHNVEAATYDKMKAILNSIAEVITWRTDLVNSFYVISKEEASKLSELVRNRTGNQGRFIITEITSNHQGWLTSESWYLINNKKLKPKQT